MALLKEVVDTYLQSVGPQLWVYLFMLAGSLALLSLLDWGQRKGRFKRFLPQHRLYITYGVFAAAVIGGLWHVVQHASLYDDAYISFRYSRNFAEGHGLVFNLGEKVEGYTNFLWTVAIGIIVKMTKIDATYTALILGFSAYIANMYTVFRLGKMLWLKRNHKVYIPVAVVGLALHNTFADYGTSGLETMAASLFVNLGLLRLVDNTSARGALVSGLMFILATFTRPDQAIFYVVGGLVIVQKSFWPLLSADQNRQSLFVCGLKKTLAYSVPFLLYAVYLVWKLHYYGDIFPNTYYAKSANLAYFSQGFIYAALFYLGSHFGLMALLFLIYLGRPAGNRTAGYFKWFSGLAFLLFNFYILKVGGDFMNGRFYVSLLPLVLLGIEDFIYRIAEGGIHRVRRLWPIAICVFAVSLSSTPIDMFPKRMPRKWGVADESRFYRVKQLYPLKLTHYGARLGKKFKRFLTDRGIRPVISTHGLGMVAYYSHLPVIDQLGLTDFFVAHQDIKERGSPGHEKHAPMDYLKKRKVLFARAIKRIPGAYQGLTRVTFGRRSDQGWTILTYQKPVLDKIKAVSKEIHFVDFPQYLDSYISRAKKESLSRLRADLAFFIRYYFKWNPDEKRLNAITSIIKQKQVEKQKKDRLKLVQEKTKKSMHSAATKSKNRHLLTIQGESRTEPK